MQGIDRVNHALHDAHVKLGRCPSTAPPLASAPAAAASTGAVHRHRLPLGPCRARRRFSLRSVDGESETTGAHTVHSPALVLDW